jgi:hypothetical protein
MKYLLLIPLFSISIYAQQHILITEFAVTPTAGEFIEIYNNTDQTIDLSDYYITDATFSGNNTYYYNIVIGSNIGGGSFSDFHARFPVGSTISPGEFQIMAMNGSDFITTYSIQPTYELYETSPSIPNMREALPGSIDSQSSLTNDGEIIVLYYWDGQSDLVQDVDYVVWGDKAEGVDKSGVAIDGPDDDSNTSAYLSDTPIAQQIAVSGGQPHDPGESVQRINLDESGEIQSGGNGITNHNETSENLAVTFQPGIPNPGTGPEGNKLPQITNVSISPQNPRADDIVTINADVTDDGIIDEVELFFSVNSLPFDSTVMANVGGSTYQAIIDAQEAGTIVYYFIKAVDDSGFITQTDTFFYTVAAPDTVITIAEIQNNIETWNGKEVKIRGVVTIGSGILITSRTEAYVQDSSGIGIQVFSFDPADPDLQRGNLVLISGTIEDYEDSNGDFTTEITDYSITVLQTDVTLPEPSDLTTGQATNGNLEGAFVEVDGTILDKYAAGGGTNIILDDGSGEVTLRIWDTANLDLSEFDVGDGIIARGVISQFGGSGQVVIGYQEDISSVILPSIPTTLKVPAKPFAPDQGEKLPISYSAGSENTHVTLRVYDLGGRLITTLIDEQGRSFEQRLEWDGTDKLNEQVPVGVYILHMEIVNESNGKRREKTAPIVIGTVISR